jgi:phenylacetate-CoA ligase
MCGYEIGDKVAFFWGSDADSQAHKGPVFRTWDRLAMNLIWVNVFDISEEQLEEEARRLARFQPKLIVGYATSLYQLARLIDRKGISGIHPSAIQSSAEVLTTEMRQAIEETFGCSVYDRYGCREMGNIAHECSEHQGLHILAENNYVEFLCPDGEPVEPGDEGLITVTNLNNLVMPLIRYQVGDIGIRSARDCACGRGLPLMDVVKGRISDVIRTPNGKLLHGEFFSHIMYNTEGIKAFQIIQKTSNELVIAIVPNARYQNKKELDRIESAILEYGDPEFDIVFQLQSSIQATGSGKHRFVISYVDDL